MRRVLASLLLVLAASCTRGGGSSFDVVVLGDAGGLREDALTAFLVAPRGGKDFIALDAGTLRAGITRAMDKRSLPRPDGDAPEETFLREHVKAYLLSHAHLDHVAGLVINSVADTPKPVMARADTLNILKDDLFNWRTWPNMTDGGKNPLGTYKLVSVSENARAIPGTDFTVEAHALSHGAPYRSTAFILRHGDAALLYLGDTGPDDVEQQPLLTRLWLAAAPLVRSGQLKAIFLECSYPDGRPDKELFGHLTPRWFLAELERLARTVDINAPEMALKEVRVVVTHIKPGVVDGRDTRDIVEKQLEEGNRLGFNLLVPRQGEKLAL